MTRNVERLDGPTPALAKALIRSLTRGTTVPEGARFIHVGHQPWLDAQYELLGEIASDGHADTKFVRGAYGAGKSHFLAVMQDHAREAGWATSHVECRLDRVQIDRFETLYPKVVEKLTARDMPTVTEGSAGEAPPDPVRLLLDKWAGRTLERAGVRLGSLRRPFDADDRLHSELQKTILRSALPADFARMLTTYARALLESDDETLNSACIWLRGSSADSALLPVRYLQGSRGTASSRDRSGFELRPIGKGTANDVMRGLLWLLRSAGYAGLVLCIDEVEELARLGNRKRQDQALQALREYVDQAGGGSGYRHMAMYLAATPEMFEGENYFPRYDALATRIQAVGKELNWRAPVIDLDKTPLSASEMRQLAGKIVAVHRIAYGDAAATMVTPALPARLVDEIMKTRFRVARPRLLTRVVVDELERARQAGSYAEPVDVSRIVTDGARKVSKEAEA